MLRLALVYSSESNETEMRAWAERAVRFFRPLVTQGGIAAARFGWANALALLQDYPTAVDVLEKGFKETGNVAYKPLLGRVHADWGRRLAARSPPDVALQWKVIRQGLQYAPEDPFLALELATLSGQKGPEAEAARQLVEQMLGDGRHGVVLRIALGAQAWAGNDFARAREHFRLAYAKAPDLPGVAYRMAWALSEGEQPDLPQALAVAEAALQRSPTDASLRDVRGHIQLKLGETKAAIDDLEFALPRLPDARHTQMALGQAYAKLGMADLAAAHFALATNQPARGSAPSTNAPSPPPPTSPGKGK